MTFFLDNNLRLRDYIRLVIGLGCKEKKNVLRTFNSASSALYLTSAIYYSNNHRIITYTIELIVVTTQSNVIRFIKKLFTAPYQYLWNSCTPRICNSAKWRTTRGNRRSERSARWSALYRPEVIFIVFLNNMQRGELYAGYFARFWRQTSETHLLVNSPMAFSPKFLILFFRHFVSPWDSLLRNIYFFMPHISSLKWILSAKYFLKVLRSKSSAITTYLKKKCFS